MSTHRPRIDRDTAEQLLRGVPAAGHRAGPLAAALAALRAPAVPEETGGERAALAAFRAAQLEPVPQPGRSSMLKIALAKLVSVKAAAVVAGLSLGGAAVATTTGVLPNPLTDTGRHAPATPSDKPSRSGGPGNADPSPSLVGLCRAYAAGATDNAGKALENPAFSALVTAAGGADNVEEFCEKLDMPGAASSHRPDAHPTGKPAGVPTAPGTHAPADAPTTGAPGRPTAPPTR